MNQSGDVTQMLNRWAAGEEAARDRLVEQVYFELKKIARSRFALERASHTLQPTALVHEAYLKLVQSENASWENRVHFIAVSARVMRQILVDSGRRKQALKRQAPDAQTLIVGSDELENEKINLLLLEDALVRLEQLSPRQAQVVELRYFGGLTVPEVAAVLDVSEATVNRAWRSARSWLYLQFQDKQN
ncbi:MAG: ECF-type sigma factor [Pseudomonadota bacterium]